MGHENRHEELEFDDHDAIDLDPNAYSVTHAEQMESPSEPSFQGQSTDLQTSSADPFQKDLFELELQHKSTERHVYKHNSLINARCNLSALCFKVLDALISIVDPYEEEVMPIVLSPAELARLIGVTRQVVDKNIKAIYKELANTPIQVAYVNEDWEKTVAGERYQAAREGRKPRHIPKPTSSESFVTFTLLDEQSYNADARMLTFIFHPRVKPLISSLRGNYTYYQLKQTRQMRSKYGMRIYGILRSALSLKEVAQGKYRAVKDVPYEELRKMLRIPEDSYPSFNGFKRYVLEKARTELEKTDLRFRYELPDRDGPHKRTPVRTIRFYILADVALSQAAIASTEAQSWEMYYERFFTEESRKKLENSFSQARIQRNIEHYAEYISIPVNKPINSPAAWVRKAIKDDFAGAEYAKQYNSTDLDELDFVKSVIQKHWATFDDDARDDFIEHGFESIAISTLFENFKAKKAALRAKTQQAKPTSKQETRRKVSESLMDIEDTNW